MDTTTKDDPVKLDKAGAIKLMTMLQRAMATDITHMTFASVLDPAARKQQTITVQINVPVKIADYLTDSQLRAAAHSDGMVKLHNMALGVLLVKGALAIDEENPSDRETISKTVADLGIGHANANIH